MSRKWEFKLNSLNIKDNLKNKKVILLILAIMIVISFLVGISYAYWRITLHQTEANTVLSDCFELQYLENTSAINLQEQYPISDEEGLKETGYSFTLKNTCKATANYQINLEDIVPENKRLSSQYIKISLNNKTPKVLNTYETVTPTVKEADMSYKIANGILKENESVTYELKLWMDYDTPTIEETMNATFESKISISASQNVEEEIGNQITVAYQSKNLDYSKEKDTLEITFTSSDLNIISYSDDKETWNDITPTKTYTFEKEYDKDATHQIYVKDENGDIKVLEINPPMLDQTGPVIIASTSNTDWQSTNRLTIKLSDEKSGLSGYQITETEDEPSSFETIAGSEYELQKEVTESKTYYIWGQDNLGNISYKKVTISYIDNEAPTILSLKEQSNYGATSLITARVIDKDSGIAGYQFTTEETEPDSWISVDSIITEIAFTYETTEKATYYFYVKDSAGHITHQQIVVSKIDNEAPLISYEISSSSTGENGWYTSLNLKANIEETGSGISHAKYCFTANESCLPNSTGVIQNNSITFSFTGKNVAQKLCLNATDFAGNTSTTTCSDLYKVDTREPVVSLKEVHTENTITLDASSSTDLDSGISGYYFSKDNGKNWILADNQSYTFTGLTAGETYELMVRVKDNAGRIVDKTITVKLTNTTSETLVNILQNLPKATSGSGLYEVSHDGATFGDRTGETEISNFQKTELRYAGSNAKNYILFNNELWQIIGYLNTSSGQKVKIISTKEYTGTNGVYNSSGTLQWSTSTLKISLNTPFYNVIGQLYRNSIDSTTWNLYRWDYSTVADADLIYQYEKQKNSANLNTEYEWRGNIGLIVPSDYAYATIGGETNDREACLNAVHNWNLYTKTMTDCIYNNWMFRNVDMWTMIIQRSSSPVVNVITSFNGAFGNRGPALENQVKVYPALYLKNTVSISGGTGSKDDPYVVEV